jgi:multidrug efflux pump subunit AcrA (membrane-fusion protein)
MNKKYLFGLMIFTLLLASCSQAAASSTATIKASGTITAESVQVASEISGKLVSISVAEGNTVKVGDPLFQLDDQLLKAQSDQANATLRVAQQNLLLAQQKLVAAQTQFDLTSQAARQQDVLVHTNAWRAVEPDEITLPGWYFSKDEEIAALQSQVKIAQGKLDDALSALETQLKDVSNQDFIAVEKALDEAQQAYLIADKTLTEARSAQNNGHLIEQAQTERDNRLDDLTNAQKDYNDMLGSDASKRVLDARALVAVTQETLTNTQDTLDKLMTGGNSLQVVAAQAALDQAKTGVTLADASLTQAQAAQRLAQIQLDKTTVVSTVAGIVLSKPLNVGEIAAAGSTVLEIGSLEQVILDVYIPESEYGRVQLNQEVSIVVDSYPGTTFEGTVTFISDQAEFTPRNVQTVESRSTTVYKVEITILNPDLKLKPGMPADATLVIQ